MPDRGLRRLLPQHRRFERLEDAPITLHVVATDVLTGADVQLWKGNAIDAIMASAAIRGIFPLAQAMPNKRQPRLLSVHTH